MTIRTIPIVCALLVSTQAFAQETQRQYLSGTGIDDAVQWEFFCSAGNKSGQWSTTPVPGCWDVAGFGSLHYGQPGPFSYDQGKYRHNFQIPASWQGQSVYLVFEGVMTDAEASVNGQSAGPKHQGAYYAFKYNITKLAKFGADNLLEVAVDEESSDPSVNKAERRGDYWNYAGIFRPVYLEAVPVQHVDRVAIDARHDGAFAMDVYTEGVTTADSIQAQVMDMTGKAFGAPIAQSLAEGNAHLQAKFDSPKQWSAETPNLYSVEVRLMQGDTVLHRYRQRFGFRTIEVRPGDGVYVNGQRVILKGVNRHTFWPDTGRAISPRISLLDVNVMKDMNCNAVRCSHYPPDAHFLDLCDELGLYVLDELGGWHQSYETTTGHRLVGEMVRHDVNHPAIVFWDNGNEGGWNTALDGDFGLWDPQHRDVLHPSRIFGDVDTNHYPVYNTLVQRTAGPNVYMPTEFLHGLFDGGAGAGIQAYWDVILKSKVAAGGFIWAYLDEAVKRLDEGGKLDPDGNQAPDGIVGPYREKEGSYFAIGQIWSPIIVTRNDNELTVENRYDFINADQCTFTWQLRKFHSPFDNESGFTVLAEGKAAAPTIPPHATGSTLLNLPPLPPEADALALRVNDSTGRELRTWVWPLKSPAALAEVHGSHADNGVTAKEDDAAIEVTSGDLALSFSKQTGYLASVTKSGQSYPLINGPRLATGTATLASIQHHADGADQVIDVTYTGDMKAAHWRIKPDGWLDVAYEYSLTGPHDFYGVSFDLPENEVKSMKWLGNGPYHVWENRLIGGTLNVWQNTYNDTITGYIGWAYPEFKGYYSDVRWMRIETTSGPILTTIDDPSLFVQVLRLRFPGDPKRGENQNPRQMLAGNAWTTFPEAGFSILHAIPPIGSKFIAASASGPASQTPVAEGDYHGAFRLFFGDPH
jgi:hypothetical protein